MQDEKHELMKRSTELEEMSCLDRARLVLDLEAQVKSLSGIMAEKENRIKELEERNGDLIKMLHEAQNDYYDLRQKKIVCPGEAARYYLEETRRLKKLLDQCERSYEV